MILVIGLLEGMGTTHIDQTIVVVLVVIPVGGHVAVIHPDIGGVL